MDFLNLQYIFYQIYRFLVNFDSPDFQLSVVDRWPLWAMISFVISMAVGVLVLYLNMKIKEVEKMDDAIFGTVWVPVNEEAEGEKNERWVRVIKHIETDSEVEWKSAILEADIILDEMTQKMGYHGDTLGERLKNVEKSDFLTLNQAWEAHKVRNTIAHDGSDYLLTKREAKRIIDLYRQVFEEFKFI